MPGRLRHRRRPVHVGIAHQREERVDAFRLECAGEHVGYSELAHRQGFLLRKRSCHHDRKARHRSRPALSSAAGAGCLTEGLAGSDADALAGIVASAFAAVLPPCSAITFAMLAENSASSARATCTPPALANVSSGPVTEKLPSTVSSVVSVAGSRDDAGCQRARGATLIDAASFDGHAVRVVVIGERSFAAEGCDSRSELDADAAAPKAIGLIGRERGARNARRDQSRIAQQRPDLIERRRYRRLFGN